MFFFLFISIETCRFESSSRKQTAGFNNIYKDIPRFYHYSNDGEGRLGIQRVRWIRIHFSGNIYKFPSLQTSMLLISVVGFILYCIESSVHHLIGYFSIFPFSSFFIRKSSKKINFQVSRWPRLSTSLTRTTVTYAAHHWSVNRPSNDVGWGTQHRSAHHRHKHI